MLTKASMQRGGKKCQGAEPTQAGSGDCHHPRERCAGLRAGEGAPGSRWPSLGHHLMHTRSSVTSEAEPKFWVSRRSHEKHQLRAFRGPLVPRSPASSSTLWRVSHVLPFRGHIIVHHAERPRAAVHSSVDGHLGCSRLSAAVTPASPTPREKSAPLLRGHQHLHDILSLICELTPEGRLRPLGPEKHFLYLSKVGLAPSPSPQPKPPFLQGMSRSSVGLGLSLLMRDGVREDPSPEQSHS